MARRGNGNTSGMDRTRWDMQECWINPKSKCGLYFGSFFLDPSLWCYCNFVTPVSICVYHL